MADNIQTRVSKFLHIVSSAWVLVLAVIILVDVVGRAVFNHPLLGTADYQELSGYHNVSPNSVGDIGWGDAAHNHYS